MSEISTVLATIARDLSKDITPDLPVRAAAAIDGAFDGQDIRSIAIQYVVESARDLARYSVMRIEQEATRARLKAELPDLPDHVLDRWEFMTEAERVKAREEDARWREVRLSNEEETRGHIGPKRPGSWSQDNLCNDCKRCQETWTQDAELRRQHDERLRLIYDTYEANLRAQIFVEWTEELLAAEIAMPDGSRTTWGLATIQQHRLRHDMLAKNAMANMENAARHSIAIEALTTSGAPNLAALVEQSAPEQTAVAA